MKPIEMVFAESQGQASQCGIFWSRCPPNSLLDQMLEHFCFYSARLCSQPSRQCGSLDSVGNSTESTLKS